MLYGRYEHTIDAKNRVFVPAKYKESLGDSFKLAYNGINQCILVYSNEEWDKFVVKINDVPEIEAGDFRRVLFSNTVDVQLDAQGRIVIPNYLKDVLKVTDDAIVKNLAILGVGNHLEIWSVEGLNAKNNSLNMNDIKNLMIQLRI